MSETGMRDAEHDCPATRLTMADLRALEQAEDERDVFARALTMACGPGDVRESYVRRAKDALARERTSNV